MQKNEMFHYFYTKYVENSEVMTLSTHSFSYRLFKKSFSENNKISYFLVFLINDKGVYNLNSNASSSDNKKCTTNFDSRLFD